jgi:hypothetical protein
MVSESAIHSRGWWFESSKQQQFKSVINWQISHNKQPQEISVEKVIK